MDIGELLTRDSILLSVKVADFETALERAATHLSYLTELRPQQILSALLEREARGTTALGGGVSLPHARCEGLAQPYGVFIRFTDPIDAAAADGEPVDMAFVLLAPESATASYLRAVGKIATILRHPMKREQLRSSDDKDMLYALLTSEDA